MQNLSDGTSAIRTNSNVTFVGTPTWAGKSAKSSVEINTTFVEDADLFDNIAVAAVGARSISAGAPTAADALGQAVFVTARMVANAAADTPGKLLITGTDLNGSTQQETLTLTNAGITADDNFFDVSADMALGARVLSATTPTGSAAGGVFVTATLTDQAASDTPGTLALVGTDEAGAAQNETLTLVANSIATSTKVFKTVTSATVASWVIGGGDADLLVVGYEDSGIVTSNKAFKTVTAASITGWITGGAADNLVVGYAANRAGVVNNPTAVNYSSSSTIDVAGLSDTKGNLIAGAVVTMTIDGDGTWDTTGTQEVVLVTDTSGNITAQGITVGSGGKSATITTATSGSFGVSSVTTKVKQNGVYATADLTGPTSTTSIIERLSDAEGSTLVARILTKDSGGNKVDSTNLPTVSCVGTDSKGAALITGATIGDTTASDGYREVSVDPAAKTSATPAVCTWKIAASGTEPATTGTFNITVADNAVKTVSVTVGDGDLTPGIPATITATLLDKNGVAIRTGQPAETVTVAVNGTSGGNQVINGATRTHKNGVVTATFIPGDKLGNFTVTATTSNATPKVGYAVVKIASATAAEPAVTITGDVSASGSSLVVVNGSASGSKIVELTDAKSVWITENGVYKGYVAGAPAFVNADFPVSNTGAVIVVK